MTKKKNKFKFSFCLQVFETAPFPKVVLNKTQIPGGVTFKFFFSLTVDYFRISIKWHKAPRVSAGTLWFAPNVCLGMREQRAFVSLSAQSHELLHHSNRDDEGDGGNKTDNEAEKNTRSETQGSVFHFSGCGRKADVNLRRGTMLTFV